jgi:iron(III) transport system permease protein
MPRLSANRSSQPAWLLPFVIIAVCLLSGLPLARLLYAGLRFSIEGRATGLFSEPSTWFAIRNTLITATAGMVISVLLGATFAFVVTLTDIRAKGFFSFAFVLPMMIPPQVTALAWVQMSGPASPLLKTLGIAPPLGSPQPLYSLGGIALLLGVQHAPLVFLALKAGLAALPRDGVEAARLAGPRRCGYFATSFCHWPCRA